MKYFEVLVCLTIQLTCSLVNGNTNQISLFSEEFERGIVNPSTCASSNSATLKTLELGGGACSNSNCTLLLDKSYTGSLVFITGKNERDISMDITFFALPPLQNVTRVFAKAAYLFRNFTTNETVTLPYSLKFFKNEFKNKSGPYRLQFELNSNSTKGLLCRTFQVNLNGNSTDNDAGTPGADCVLVGHPCAFDHSTCVKSGTKNACQCDASYYFDSGKKGCKKVDDGNCLIAADCITNADCKNEGSSDRKCRCNQGFIYDKNEFSCKSGASSVLLSMFVLVILQLASHTFK